MLYQFCFSLSQRCDSLQKDNGIFLKFCYLTDEGIDTQRVLGTAVGSRSVKREIVNSAKKQLRVIARSCEGGYRKWVLDNLDDRWLDKSVHQETTYRWKYIRSRQFLHHHLKVVKDIKAIPRTEVKTIHNPKGIDVESSSLFLFSQSSFENLSQSYVATLPELSALFFDPSMERQRLEANGYHAATTVRSMRSFCDVHLLDFVKLPLKSRENYETALD